MSVAKHDFNLVTQLLYTFSNNDFRIFDILTRTPLFVQIVCLDFKYPQKKK